MTQQFSSPPNSPAVGIFFGFNPSANHVFPLPFTFLRRQFLAWPKSSFSSRARQTIHGDESGLWLPELSGVPSFVGKANTPQNRWGDRW